MSARSRRVVRAAASVLLAGTAAACGIGPTGAVRAGPPASGAPRPGADSVRLYFADAYGVRAVTRPADRPPGPQHALDLLLAGPTPAERARGLTTHVPRMAGQFTATATTGAVDVVVPVAVADGELDVAAINQLACTAAHSDVPGDLPPEQVDVRIYEDGGRYEEPWTVRCGPNGNAVPVTD